MIAAYVSLLPDLPTFGYTTEQGGSAFTSQTYFCEVPESETRSGSRLRIRARLLVVVFSYFGQDGVTEHLHSTDTTSLSLARRTYGCNFHSTSLKISVLFMPVRSNTDVN